MKRGMMRGVGVVVIAFAALMLPTCISAEEQDLVKYDAASDEFRMLMVLTDIKAKDADDLGYLEGIYRNRDHLIAPVIPGGAAAFPMFAVSAVRASDTQASILNLFSSRPTSFDLTTTTAALSTIKITPGAFFLENGKLGYYQAVTVPGKVVDTVLGEISKMPGDDMVKGIDDELKRRADGGKTNTWAELKADAVKRITIKPTGPDEAGEPVNPLMVVSEESLKKIKAAVGAKDKSMGLARNKQSLALTIPLTAADAKEAADLVQASIKRVDEVIKEAQGEKQTEESAEQIKIFKGFQTALKAVTATGDEKGFVMSVDILKLAEVAGGGAPVRVDMNGAVKVNGEEAPKEVPPDVVAYLKEKKIAVDEKLTAAQVIKDFNAGTLKGNASETAVKPGEGIVKGKE